MKNRFIWAVALAVMIVYGVRASAISCTDIDADASKYKIVIGKLKRTVNGIETSITKKHSMTIRSAMWTCLRVIGYHGPMFITAHGSPSVWGRPIVCSASWAIVVAR